MRGLAAALLLWPLLGQSPQRIVSTAPSITETLFAAGLGSRVAGVTTYCRYPEQARRLPKIGTFLEPDFEKILALRPDLVLTLKNPVQLTERLRKLRLNAIELDQDSIASIFRSLETIGQATGAAAQTSALASKLRAGLDEVARSTAGAPKLSVLFVIGRTPGTLEGMVAAGTNSYLDELLQYAGGRNVFHDSPIPYPKISHEELLSRDPEVILDLGDYAHAQGSSRERQEQVLALWQRYPKLRAVRNRRVYGLASDIFVVPGPRMVEAVREFRRLLHPETVR